MNVKFLEHCKPGDLVRARFGPNVEWGIVGYEGVNSQQQRRVVVISGDNSPWCLNPEDAVSACLSYGREYDLLPEYGGPCEVFNAQGPAFAHAGMLVYACPSAGTGTTDSYLIARATGRFESLIFLNLEQFRVIGSEPGGNRAGFKRWSIWMMLPPRGRFLSMVRIIRKRREPLSRWIEDNVRVPSGISAVSGPLKLHPYRAASPTRSRTQRSSGCRF
jgi:hypothetical protein